MTYSLGNNCTKNYYNRTLTVQVIVEDVVTWIFLRHSVEVGLNDSLLCDVNASRPIVLLTDVHHTTARQSIAGSHL